MSFALIPNGTIQRTGGGAYPDDPADASLQDFGFEFLTPVEQAQQLQDQNNANLEYAALMQYLREVDAANSANTFAANQAQLNRDWQTEANEKAMAFESLEAEIYRNWIDQQRSTAYQTAVTDLKEAGLNPILAASGSGAAVAAGATASGFSSAGATAQTHKASAQKADVDIATIREIFNTLINGSYKLAGSLIDKLPFGSSTGKIGF